MMSGGTTNINIKAVFMQQAGVDIYTVQSSEKKKKDTNMPLKML